MNTLLQAILMGFGFSVGLIIAWAIGCLVVQIIDEIRQRLSL